MIQFDRIELETYPNRPFDPIDIKAKEAFNSTYKKIEYNVKKIKSKFVLRILTRFASSYFGSLHFDSICFGFNLVRVKFGCFIVVCCEFLGRSLTKTA